MELRLKPIAASLSPAMKALRPGRVEFDRFATALNLYLSRINERETEENHKTHLIDVFKAILPPHYLVEPHERIDFVIRAGDMTTPPVVLVETKTQRNRAEMISERDINRKALHEAVLYYMRERERGNVAIAHIIICSTFEFYVFEAKQFERAFYGNPRFRKLFVDWAEGRSSDATTDFFYRQIAFPFIMSSDVQLEATYLDVRQSGERTLLGIYKVLSPQNLVKDLVANDSNALNKDFYDELLYIVGLEEVREGAKKLIRRRRPATRRAGSLLELALAELEQSDALNDPELILQYGSMREERSYTIALELCLTWVNRLLFLKLLEAQLVSFHQDPQSYEFLNERSVRDFGDLANLFFLVLAREHDERPERVKRYENVPYLNSSLFERTPLEYILNIGTLSNQETIVPYSKTVLREGTARVHNSALSSLSYVLRFLAAYDFGSVAGGEIRENNKNLISASVLGLIFEKINGYQDGAVFTPGLITMNMSRRVIEAAAIDAFKAEFPEWNVASVVDISNHIVDRSREAILRMNRVIDRLKICDPAVGSGHFLVSCLNELISLKSRLGILADRDGGRLVDYEVFVDNDELVVVQAESNEIFSYRVPADGISPRVQHIQQSLFEEKRKLIENCLFGVDINRNSVRICQLRLWIELLKNAFYRADGTLETLPNIDINIKVGDSLLSRFPLEQSLSSAFRAARLTVRDYRDLVDEYKNTRDKAIKRQLEGRLGAVKERFQEEALGRLTRSINAEIAALRAREAQLGLFEISEQEEDARNAQLDTARAAIARLEQRLQTELRRRTFLSALEWRFEFPEILSPRGEFEGFDIVIGNPPYGVSVTGERREIITQSVGKVPDFEIYYMFLNQGRRLLKPGGRLTFIIPNMILSNVYAKTYRLNLLGEWSEVEIDDLTDFRVFSDAVVHNVIVTAKKGSGRPGVLFRKTGQSASISEYLDQDQEIASAELLAESNRNWGLVFRLDSETAAAVLRTRADTVPLKAIFSEVSQGLIAYDQYQGQDQETIQGRVFHKDHETETTSHWINGEDVRRFSLKWNGKDYLEYCDELANPRQPKFFQEPRVLVREITNPRIYAAYTTEVAYNDPAIINILASNDERFSLQALEAILNSQLATFYHFNSSPKATKGSFPKILVDDIREFPLPNPDLHSEQLRAIDSLGSEIRSVIGDETKAAELAELEDALDETIYELYGLDEEAVALIKKLFASNPSLIEVGPTEPALS